MRLIVFLLSVVLATAAPGCPKYLDGNSLDENICVEEEESGDISVRACTELQVCPVNELDLPNKCKTPPAVINLLAGELCKDDAECFSLKCINYRCKGFELNEKCEELFECDNGLICGREKEGDAQLKCLPARKIGEECADSLDCIVPLRCVERECVKAGSQPIGSVVGDFNELACNSYYTRKNDKGDWVCAESPKLSGQTWPLKEPPLCTTESPCKYSVYNNEDIKNGCKCGKTENGTSYCKAYPGDFNLTEVSSSL